MQNEDGDGLNIYKYETLYHLDQCKYNLTWRPSSLDEDEGSLHQQSEEEMPKGDGAEQGEAATHRDPGEVPGRPAVPGPGAVPDAAGDPRCIQGSNVDVKALENVWPRFLVQVIRDSR